MLDSALAAGQRGQHEGTVCQALVPRQLHLESRRHYLKIPPEIGSLLEPLRYRVAISVLRSGRKPNHLRQTGTRCRPRDRPPDSLRADRTDSFRTQRASLCCTMVVLLV